MADDVPRLPDPTPTQVLRAVSECAVDLADLRDPHMVLQAIVRRTRALLRTDMAYLSLNDLAQGETHIEVTDGVRTEAYRTIRMPLGTGVLGAVAAGGTDVRTTDYLRDPDMNHLTHIDDIVLGEGVHAIHGCPVRVGGRVVAALLVAQRTVIRFTSRQTAALRRMAEQCALAMERGGAGIGDSLQPFVDDVVERVPFGPHAVCALLSERLEQPVELHGREPVIDGADPDTLRTALTTSLHSGAPVALPTAGGTVTVAAVPQRGEHAATLVVPYDPVAIGERGRLLISRALVAVGSALLAEQRLAEVEMRSGGDLVAELLRADHVDDDLLTRLIALGFTRRRPVTAVVMATREGTAPHDVTLASAQQLAGRGAVLVSHAAEQQTVLAQVSSPHAFAERLHASVEDGAVVGWAVATGGLDHVGQAHTAATRTLRALQALGMTGVCADPGRLGPAALVVAGTDPDLVAQLVTSRLGPLLEHDRGDRLTETAWVVLECGGRLREAARRLHIHPNTVRQRCERVAGLLGPGWRHAPESLDTHFALRLWRVQTALADRP